MIASMHDLAGIGRIIELEALTRFQLCGAEDDYCIESVDYHLDPDPVVVFGNENRVIFSLDSYKQWQIGDRCTDEFRRKWDNLFE